MANRHGLFDGIYQDDLSTIRGFQRSETFALWLPKRASLQPIVVQMRTGSTLLWEREYHLLCFNTSQSVVSRSLKRYWLSAILSEWEEVWRAVLSMWLFREQTDRRSLSNVRGETKRHRHRGFRTKRDHWRRGWIHHRRGVSLPHINCIGRLSRNNAISGNITLGLGCIQKTRLVRFP